MRERDELNAFISVLLEMLKGGKTRADRQAN